MLLTRNEEGAIVSPCRECIFAEYRVNPEKEWQATQTGCLFNRPEKFKNRGTKVEWVEDDDVAYHKIHVFCNTMRDREWQKENGIEPSDIEKAKLRVIEDNKVRWCGIVLCDSSTELDCIKTTLDWMTSVSIPAQSIVVSLRSKDSIKYIQEIRETYKNTEIPLYFNRCLEVTYDREPLDQCALKCDGQYYVGVKAGKTFGDVVERLETSIKDCRLVGVVTGEDILICHIGIHKVLGENKVENIEKKMVDFDEKFKVNVVELEKL